MATLVSVNVGRAQAFTVGERKFRSAILKAPAEGRVMLGELGLEGDQQSDHRYHGGPMKAVYLYSAEHYAFWAHALKSDALPPGTLGENLTIGGLDGGLEQALHVGDVLQVGGARVQLTTPRQPCWKLETRMGLPGFAKAFLESGRIGMYARVVQEGEVAAGDDVSVFERAPKSATIADLIRALYFEDGAAAERVLADPRLAPELRRRLRKIQRNEPLESSDLPSG
jgi:MOSC domain-containing protein YiiM